MLCRGFYAQAYTVFRAALSELEKQELPTGTTSTNETTVNIPRHHLRLEAVDWSTRSNSSRKRKMPSRSVMVCHQQASASSSSSSSSTRYYAPNLQGLDTDQEDRDATCFALFKKAFVVELSTASTTSSSSSSQQQPQQPEHRSSSCCAPEQSTPTKEDEESLLTFLAIHYNLAITCHVLGQARGQTAWLQSAFTHYLQVSGKLLTRTDHNHDSPENNKQHVHDNSAVLQPTALLCCLATSNNMGHLCGLLWIQGGVRTCHSMVQTLLFQAFDDLADDDLQFFMTTLLVWAGRPVSLAPAA